MKHIKYIVFSALYAALTHANTEFTKQIKKLQKKSPADISAFFNLGNSRANASAFDDAIECYSHIITMNKGLAQVYFNRGQCYLNSGNIERALTDYKEALRCDPCYTRAWSQAGRCYEHQNNKTAAINAYERAFHCDTNNIDAIRALAQFYHDDNRAAESCDMYTRLIKLNPNDPQALLTYANLLNQLNKTEESLYYYQLIDSVAPNNPTIVYNIAYTLKKLNRLSDAMPYYKRALELAPNNHEARFSLGLAYLVQGNFLDGFAYYEARFDRGETKKRIFEVPEWDGISAVNDKRFLLIAEQGLGDTFQFCRYAHALKSAGAYVILAVQKPLKDIISLLPYIDKVYTVHEPLPEFDTYAYLLSMPHLCKTMVETVANEIPYLYADEALEKEWQEKLSHNTTFKIGICWQGNPDYGSPFLRAAVAAKSVHMDFFAPLTQLPDVTVYSLQRMTGTDQVECSVIKNNLVFFDETFDNAHGRFMDTAAVMKNLDLMITVDTSIAHLAAGLGLETWILIPNPPDWRWMLDRIDTPWYPNMTLYRQPTPGDWNPVMEKIMHDLHIRLLEHA